MAPRCDGSGVKPFGAHRRLRGVHEQSHSLLNPGLGRRGRITRRRLQTGVDHLADAWQIRIADQLLTATIRTHVTFDPSVRHRDEPLRAQ